MKADSDSTITVETVGASHKDDKMNSGARESTPSFEACWNYILELYSKQGVSESCLLLQDRLGVDVSFLLVVIFYAEQRSVWIEPEHLKEFDESISDWRHEVVRPLRAMRLRLKQNLSKNPSSTASELYRQIKASEIIAEKGEIEILTKTLDRKLTHGSLTANLRETISKVVDFYDTQFLDASRRTSDYEVQEAISSIAAAARSKGPAHNAQNFF